VVACGVCNWILYLTANSNENFINKTYNDLIGDFMGIDLGRLRSPLSDAELVLKMIRELKESYNLHLQVQDSMAKKHFKILLKFLKDELGKVEDVAEKTKVQIIRLEDELKSVESSLNSYRRNLKKIAKKDPSAKQAMEFVESLLADVRKIKSHIINESRRSIIEEQRVIRNA